MILILFSWLVLAITSPLVHPPWTDILFIYKDNVYGNIVDVDSPSRNYIMRTIEEDGDCFVLRAWK